MQPEMSVASPELINSVPLTCEQISWEPVMSIPAIINMFNFFSDKPVSFDPFKNEYCSICVTTCCASDSHNCMLMTWNYS